jgi:8-oxo-dGTP pyrophosphatase MutT (NUDIX family)
MIISESYKGRSGVEVIFEYHDADSFNNLPPALCRQVYGVCFSGDRLVIGYGGQKQDWGLVGGTIEPGEMFEETLAREIAEETNMQVISSLPLGYQKVVYPKDQTSFYQLRYVCTVKPLGPFVKDPDGGITEIKLIDPRDYKKYFDWGKIGERIITRALELKEKL